jgi:hypothetical protein
LLWLMSLPLVTCLLLLYSCLLQPTLCLSLMSSSVTLFG